MLWPKKNAYKEFDSEKKFLRLENSSPPPPITFLIVRPLTVINNDKGRNAIAALVQSMPPVDWTSLQRIAARGNIPR